MGIFACPIDETALPFLYNIRFKSNHRRFTTFFHNFCKFRHSIFTMEKIPHSNKSKKRVFGKNFSFCPCVLQKNITK